MATAPVRTKRITDATSVDAPRPAGEVAAARFSSPAQIDPAGGDSAPSVNGSPSRNGAPTANGSPGRARSPEVLAIAVDARPLVRSGLAAVARSAFGAGAEAHADLPQALAAVERARWLPHLLLLGLRTGDSPAALTRRAREIAPLVLLALDGSDPDLIRAAIGARANGLVAIEELTPESLIAAVDAAEFGEPTLPAAFVEHREELLTARGREILAALAAGLQDDEIAIRLGISTSSVRKHLATAQARLGARTRTQAVAIATRERLL